MTDSSRPKGLYILGAQPYQWIYGAPERERIAGLVDIIAPAQTAESIRATWICSKMPM